MTTKSARARTEGTSQSRARRESDRVRIAPTVGAPEVALRTDALGRSELAVRLRGAALLRHPLTNKQTAFTLEERRALGLDALLPETVNTLSDALARAYATYETHGTALSKHVFLRHLLDTDETLFHALVASHLEEMLPVVYTPTVGDVVQRYHRLSFAPRGLTLPGADPDRIRALIDAHPADDVRMIVVTDSSAILGIGDQGHGGLAIAIGKLALYTVAGGVAPHQALPVVLDVGTDREDLRADPLYLGARHPRLRGEAHRRAIDAFADAVRRRWPRAVVQWEDFAKDTAFDVLERHQGTLPSFNDDIQGTGAVALAGVLSACLSKGERLSDQRVVIHGAGAGGAGVAWAITEGMIREGLTRDEARRRVFVLDSRGLLIEGRSNMEAYKGPFAQPADAIAGWSVRGDAPDLVETVHQARATVLLGLSGQRNAFSEAVLRWVASHTEHPIVFALSNPNSASEADPADILRCTDGRALVATGSPYPDVEHEGRVHPIGQGNNAFVFPGLGLATILAGVARITDTMVLEAAYALADYTEEHHLAEGRIYPPVSELREVAVHVAARVMAAAARDGVAITPSEDLEQHARAHMFEPRYLPVVPA